MHLFLQAVPDAFKRTTVQVAFKQEALHLLYRANPAQVCLRTSTQYLSSSNIFRMVERFPPMQFKRVKVLDCSYISQRHLALYLPY